MNSIVSKRQLFRVVLIVSAMLIFITGVVAYWFYTVEDAYINFRYCDNLLSGKGLVFNPGERVEGYTNFLWIIVISISRLLLPFPLAAKLPGLLSGLALLLLLYKMQCPKSSNGISGAIAALIVAICPGFQLWSVAGLETVFFTLLIVAAIYFHEKATEKMYVVSGVIFGLSTLTRPEGFLLFFLFCVSIVLLNLKKPQIVIRYVLGFAIIVIPHLLFRYLYYQSLIPNTYWVKGHRFQGGGLAYFQRYAAMTGVFIVPAAFVGLVKKHLHHSILPLIVMGTGYLIYVYQIGGDWMPYGRFLIPALPLFALSAARVSMNFNVVLPLHSKILKALLVGLVVLSIIVSGVSAGYDLLRWRPTRYMGILKWENRHIQDWKTTAKWLKQNYPSDTYLSTGLAGVIPYYTGFKTLDRGGLNDREIARIIYNADSFADEKEQIEIIIVNRKPDIVMIESLSFNMLRESPLINAEMLSDNPNFLSMYELKTTQIDGRFFSYYVLTQRIREEDI